MAEDVAGPGIPAALAIVVILLVGFLLAVISFFVRSSDTLFTILLGTGTALLAAAAVVTFERLVPPWTQRIQLFRTHADIYNEFERMLSGLRTGVPHVIRTINSFLPQRDTEERWDNFATDYLRNNPSTTFVRVVSAEDTPHWQDRLKRMQKRYTTPNYHQYTALKGAVPPIEMFLVDDREVLLSFGTPATPQPPVTFGIKLRDPQVCGQLEAYHRTQLEEKIDRTNTAQRTLDQQTGP